MLAKNLITETLLNSKLDTSIDKYNVLLWNIYILANTRVNAGDFSNIGYIYLMFV